MRKLIPNIRQIFINVEQTEVALLLVDDTVVFVAPNGDPHFSIYSHEACWQRLMSGEWIRVAMPGAIRTNPEVFKP